MYLIPQSTGITCNKLKKVIKAQTFFPFFFFGRKKKHLKRQRYILQDEDQFEKIPQYLLPRALLIFKNLE